MATPIGNLADISQRALAVLRDVDTIAAEDTRVTGRLLSHYGIAARLMPLHEHNEKRATGAVLALLAAGRSVALVCDAGTPAISDPGALLVAAARAAGCAVTPVPGANAAAAALSVAGFAAPRFLFSGFLPAQPGARRKALDALAALPYTLVFHEAPHRIAACLEDLRNALGGGRRIVIARELTKRFESVHACALADAPAWLAADADRRKGEFVLVVEGAPPAPPPETEPASRALEVLLDALPLKQAVELAASIGGGRRNALYRMALAMRKARDS